MKKWKKILLGCGLTFLIFCCLVLGMVYLAFKPKSWVFKEKLPSSASSINEWFWEDAFLGEYVYHLKAKMTENNFFDYVKQFKMKKFDQREDTDNVFKQNNQWSWIGSEKPKWWNPSDSDQNTYFFKDGRYWMFAKYENDLLYVKAFYQPPKPKNTP